MHTSTIKTNVNMGSPFNRASTTPAYCHIIDNYKLKRNQMLNLNKTYKDNIVLTLTIKKGDNGKPS